MTGMGSFPFDQDIVWTPTHQDIGDSQLYAFLQRFGFSSFEELLRRAEAEPEWFWDAVLHELGIRFRVPYSRVLDVAEGPAWARWCVDGRMNIVESCLDRWVDAGNGDAIALRWEGENGEGQAYSFRELRGAVGRCAGALRAHGFGKGDVAAFLMPMTPELAVSFLAVIHLGGIVLPLFSGYGPEAVAARLLDAAPRVLFTANSSRRRGKSHYLKEVADAALDAAPVELVVVTRHQGEKETSMCMGRDLWWDDFLAAADGPAPVEIVDAETACLLIYTSGTTGKPKAAVHTHCGFPVKAAQDMKMCMDIRPGDVLFWLTDMGWMMGPWELLGGLICGATVVFYDGAPDFPTSDRLWALAETHGVTHLGVSPVLIRALMALGTAPIQGHAFPSLRALCSTGSPWDPDSWWWAFEHVLKRAKPIINYSGGTEISGGILCGNFLTPLKPCAFSGPVPGMVADVVDDHGNPLRNHVGELIIRQPWIGMTRGFWKAPERYLEAYWSRFPGVWAHGDYAARDEDGLWFLLGRSDATIKISGKRLGPAEVESLVNAHAAVSESAAIGVPHPVKDQELVVFCVLKPEGRGREAEIRAELLKGLEQGLGKSFIPREIRFCGTLPKTRNAKVMHRVIRAAYLGEPVGDLSGLENPDALRAIGEARSPL